MVNYKVCFLVLFNLILVKSFQHSISIINDNHFIEVPSQDRRCAEFINPKPLMDTEYSLQSPNYPELYPLNLDCIHIIKAPLPNMVIKLEFREMFDMEESNDCSNDFLQINNGPFGFSKTLLKLCGKEISREVIQSSGPYLWLRFHSDKTLTNSGFKFIYKFLLERERGETSKICYRKVTIPNSHSAYLSSNNLKRHPTNDFRDIEECVFDISVNAESNIFLSVAHINSTGMNNLRQFIEIYDRVTTPMKINRFKNFHLIDEKSNIAKVLLKHQRAVIRIVFRSIESVMNFQFVLTALVTRTKNKCSDDEYTCDGQFCISNQLACNKYINCPEADDEVCRNGKLIKNEGLHVTQSVVETEKKEKSQEKDHQQLHGFILGIISLFLVCMLIGCIIHSVRQNKLHSKSKKPPVKNVISLDDGVITKPENSKPIPCTITLSDDVLNKNFYSEAKRRTSVNNKTQSNAPISIIYKDFSQSKGVPQYNLSYIPNFTCSIDCDNLSKSISNVDQFHNHGATKQVPDFTSLPNFSTESVKNLFEDDIYPVVEEITVMKPVRMKIYT